MGQDQYTVEKLNKALDGIATDHIELQQAGLNIINGALCRAFASSYDEVATWAVAGATRDVLVSLLERTAAKAVEVNCFHAMCNICTQMIDAGGKNNEELMFVCDEERTKFKEVTYQYAQRFLPHKNINIRWRAAMMCLHWGDRQGWEIICRDISNSRLDGAITLIATTRMILCEDGRVLNRYDLYGNPVERKELISRLQATALKQACIPLMEKEKEKYPDEHTAERMAQLAQYLEDILEKAII